LTSTAIDATGALVTAPLLDAALDLEFLGHGDFDLQPPIVVGDTPEGTRLIFPATGGTFRGPRIQAVGFSSGGDWLRLRPDGSAAVDVRGAIQTHDGAVIYIRYEGRIIATPEQRAVLLGPDSPGDLTGADYRFRVTPYFETADERYAWLNEVISVGVGELRPGGVRYDFYALN
jgi:hypothetical protein